MKILFLVEPQQDYGEFMCWNGLVNIFGEDNIIIYPFKLSYMGFKDTSYVLDDGKRGMTCPASYVQQKKLRLYAFEEIVQEMNNIDIIVLSSPRTYPVRALRFIKQVYNGLPKPLAFMDFEDGSELRTDLIEEFNPQFIFKRELTHQIAGVHPLPFSAIVPHLDIYKEIENLPKTLDIFALFGNTHEIRSRIVKFLLEQKYENSYIGIDTGALPWQDDKRFTIPPLKGYNEYLKTMASAKINIVLRGHGRDTVRYWEAASFETLMLIRDPGIIIPNQYIDKVHAVYFNDEYDLKEKIDYYLTHDEERIAIAQACKEHTLKYHTNAQRIMHDFLPVIRGEK